MTERDERRRLAAVCDHCGSVYAAVELATGEIQPIGHRKGCSSCGGTEFSPVSEQGLSDLSEHAEGDDDD